jgi:hypothetical protein
MMTKGWLKAKSQIFGFKGEIKYGLLIIAVAFFLVMVLTPIPKSLIDLVSEENPIGYQLQPGTKSITESVSKILGTELSPEKIAYKAKMMRFWMTSRAG